MPMKEAAVLEAREMTFRKRAIFVIPLVLGLVLLVVMIAPESSPALLFNRHLLMKDEELA
jgi:hypothetical protein